MKVNERRSTTITIVVTSPHLAMWQPKVTVHLADSKEPSNSRQGVTMSDDKIFKVAIVGGRDFNDIGLLTRKCNKFLALKRSQGYRIQVLCGMAKGADLLGKEYAKRINYEVIEFPANWHDLEEKPCKVRTNNYGDYNTLAGMNRNQRMRNAADAIIAFWDGESSGTKEMIDMSKKMDLLVRVVYYG